MTEALWRWALAAALVGCAPAPSERAPDGGVSTPSPPLQIERDGFAFANYRNFAGVTNLTADEMVRLFGERVCVPSPLPGCQLSFNTRRWMQRLNRSMDAGHCFGMAATSLMLVEGALAAADFGEDAAHAADLSLEDNPELQRQIAYAYALQELTEVWSRDYGNWGTRATPSQVLAYIEEGLAAGERFVLGLAPPSGGGHAIAVVDVRRSPDGTARIVAYDNNFPGEEVEIVIDPAAETWRYDLGAVLPDDEAAVWSGDATTFSLSALPLSAMVGLDAEQVTCPPSVCGLFEPAADVRRTVRIEGQVADYLVEDDDGRRLGRSEGTLHDEIPDAGLRYQRGQSPFWLSPPPVFDLPPGSGYAVQLTPLDSLDVEDFSEVTFSVEGQGFTVGVTLSGTPGEELYADFGDEVAQMNFAGLTGEILFSWFDLRQPDADWRIELGMGWSETDAYVWVNGRLDAEGRVLTASVTHSEADEAELGIDLFVSRRVAGAAGEPDCFWGVLGDGFDFALLAGDATEVQIAFGEWDFEVDEIPVRVDLDGDGWDPAQGDSEGWVSNNGCDVDDAL